MSYAARCLVLVALISVAVAQEPPAPRLLQGHRTKIACFALSPDGRLLASGGGDKGGLLGFGRPVWLDCTIRVWDAATGEPIRNLEGHEQVITQMVFSTDGKRLVSASTDQTVRVWDVNAGKLIRQFAGTRGTISGDGRTAAVTAADAPIDLFDIESGEQRQQMVGHVNGTALLVFSPDGSTLISAGADNALRAWDVRTGKAMASMTGVGLPLALAISAGGKHIICAGQDKMLHRWELGTWKAAEILELGDGRLASLSPDGTWLAIVVNDEVRLWNAQEGRQTSAFRLVDRTLSQLAITPDGRRLFAASPTSTHVLMFSAPDQ